MTAQSIPLSTVIGVQPSVLSPAGNPLKLNGVFFTQDSSIPVGTVQSFATLAAVQAWFGIGSVEAALATIYFNGFSGATLLPGSVLFMQYNTAAVGGYVRGGSLAGLTLVQLQALSGTLITITDGAAASTSAAINLASASSFTNAAALIQTGIQAGSPATTATCTWDALRQGFVIKSPTTGASSTEAFVTGTLAVGLKLTQATGAVLSGGAVIATPAVGVAALVAATQNWACLTTTWEPITADKVAFATAINGLGQAYAYVGWDTDVTAAAGASPTSFAVVSATLNGRVAIWGLAAGVTRPDGSIVGTTEGAVAKAAWFLGATASINFNETNGALDYSWQGQAGLIPDVTDATVASNLEANGYNYYAKYASGASQFINFQRGLISGTWKWADAYVDQIQMSSDFQISLATWRSQQKKVPYAQRGYNGIRATLLDPIKRHLNFGSIVAGVTLSASQRQQVNTAAGLNIADTLQSQGWFLLITNADPSVRITRGSPPITFWYMDGGSIQRIFMAAVDVQ